MTYVKICGITNFADAEAAVEAGADLLGFIFYEPSPRYVTPERVKQIIDRLETRSASSTKPRGVGVFVNTPQAEVSRILEFCGLEAAQLHGEEPPQVVAQFGGRAYKALRPASVAEAEEQVQKYSEAGATARADTWPALLLDAYHPALYGGTGRVADWSLAASLARRHALMLAGSLTPDNVAEAIRAVAPWGVDVSSGVEREKGRKDHKKVAAFIKTAKTVQLD